MPVWIIIQTTTSSTTSYYPRSGFSSFLFPPTRWWCRLLKAVTLWQTHYLKCIYMILNVLHVFIFNNNDETSTSLQIPGWTSNPLQQSSSWSVVFSETTEFLVSSRKRVWGHDSGVAHQSWLRNFRRPAVWTDMNKQDSMVTGVFITWSQNYLRCVSPSILFNNIKFHKIVERNEKNTGFLYGSAPFGTYDYFESKVAQR